MKLVLTLVALVSAILATAENSFVESIVKTKCTVLIKQQYSCREIAFNNLDLIKRQNRRMLPIKQSTALNCLEQNKKYIPSKKASTVGQHLHAKTAYHENILQLFFMVLNQIYTKLNRIKNSKKRKKMEVVMTIVAMLCAFIATAENSINENLISAESSPLIHQSFSCRELSVKGLAFIKRHDGMELLFEQYTALSSSESQENFIPLMKNTTINQYLHAKPAYLQSICCYRIV